MILDDRDVCSRNGKVNVFRLEKDVTAEWVAAAGMPRVAAARVLQAVANSQPLDAKQVSLTAVSMACSPQPETCSRCC
jgi:hypothetical protein